MSCQTTATDPYFCPEGCCWAPTTAGSCPGHIVQRSGCWPCEGQVTNRLSFPARLRRNCLTEEGDPVLARIWNNEDDAIYDEMEKP